MMAGALTVLPEVSVYEVVSVRDQTIKRVNGRALVFSAPDHVIVNWCDWEGGPGEEHQFLVSEHDELPDLGDSFRWRKVEA